MPYFKGVARESPRDELLYRNDDRDLMALRFRDWKAVFMEQNTEICPKTPLTIWQGSIHQAACADAL
jgi:hypothetical protein